METTITSKHPIREMRQRATRKYTIRVVLLVSLIAGIVYLSWFSPASRSSTIVQVEIVP